jgi:pimeloyl-ACP methyl ester carboxylesterase
MESPMRQLSLAIACVWAIGCGDDVPADTDGTESASTSTADAGTTGGIVGTTHTGVGTTGVDTTAGVDDSTGSTGEPPPEPLVWIDDCVVLGTDLSDLHPRVECAGITVPLDWDDPDGETIEVAAFRVRSEAARHKGAIWHLDGGPGGSGISFLANASHIAELNDAGWDVMVHSHRGTLIPRLSCVGDVNGASCRTELESTWGDGLRHFNTVSAAHDQAEFMRRAAVDDDGLTIAYGVSYGSYWGQFLVGLHPEVVDGVVLDSVLGAYTSVATQEAAIDERMLSLLQACVDDPVCGPRVGFASGAAFAQAVVDAFDNGDCGPLDGGQWADSGFRGAFGQMLNTATVRNYLPLLAAVVGRCTPEDSELVSTAINAIFTRVFSAAPGGGSIAEKRAAAEAQSNRYGLPGNLFGAGVMFPVVVSTTMLPDDANIAVGANVLATTGLPGAVLAAHEFFADLPDVAFDSDFVPRVPVLILNAAYDVQTPLPWAEAVATQYGTEVLVVPDGQHGVINPGNGGAALDGTPCTRPILLAFAADPTQPVDDACVATLPQVDVNLTRPDLLPVNQAAFGVDDPWSLLQ